MPAASPKEYVKARNAKGQRQISIWTTPEQRQKLDEIKRTHGLRNKGDVIDVLLRQFERTGADGNVVPSRSPEPQE